MRPFASTLLTATAAVCIAAAGFVPDCALAAQAKKGSERGAEDSGWHAGLGLGTFRLRMETTGLSQTNNEFGGYVMVGKDFSDMVGAELRLGAAGSGSTAYPAGTLGSASGFTFGIKDSYFFSYLLKLETSSENQLRGYGLLGGTTAKLESTNTDPTVAFGGSGSHTGFTYGLGIEGSIADQLTLGAEWVRYWNSNTAVSSTTNGLIDGISATLKYHF